MKLLSAILFTMSLETGYLFEYHVATPREFYPQNLTGPVLYTEYAGEMSAGPVFVNWGLTAKVTAYRFDNYAPMTQGYDIGGGLRFDWLTLGVNYFCEHSVEPYQQRRMPIDRVERKVYLRVERSW